MQAKKHKKFVPFVVPLCASCGSFPFSQVGRISPAPGRRYIAILRKMPEIRDSPTWHWRCLHIEGVSYVRSSGLDPSYSYPLLSPVPVMLMRFTRQVLYFLLAIAALSAAACNRGDYVEAARETRQPTVTPAEQEFLMKAADANLSNIDVARLAMHKSQNSDVKDFANMIQSDDASALEDLTDLMNDKGVSLPNTLSPETKTEIETMTALSGAELDREFANMMVAQLQKEIGMYHDQVEIAQTPDVRKYAEDLLPRLEMHLEKAQRLQSKLFGESRK